MAKMCHQ